MSEWQPIETAPKDQYRTVILAYVGDLDGEPFSFSCVGYWVDPEHDAPDNMGHDGGWTDEHYSEFIPARSFGNPKYMRVGRQPTHWMPLPEPPSC